MLLKVATYNEDSKYKMLIIKIQGIVTWQAKASVVQGLVRETSLLWRSEHTVLSI